MPPDHGFSLTRMRTSVQRDQMRRRVVQNNRSLGVQGRPRSLPFQHGELLAQSEDFEGGNTPTSNEHAQRSQAGKDRFDEHEPIF